MQGMRMAFSEIEDLQLIRDVSGFESQCLFRSCYEYKIIGKSTSYKELSENLRERKSTVTRIHLRGELDSRVTLVQVKFKKSNVQIAFYERPILLHGNRTMELLILANPKGFRTLAKIFERTAALDQSCMNDFPLDDLNNEKVYYSGVVLRIFTPCSDVAFNAVVKEMRKQCRNYVYPSEINYMDLKEEDDNAFIDEIDSLRSTLRLLIC